MSAERDRDGAGAVDPGVGGTSAGGTVAPGFWRDRRVLLTGHTGFKGAWLALWLQSLGARVTGFSAKVPTRRSLYELARVGEGMANIDGDVRDPEAIAAAVVAAEPEVVVHMAAQSLVRRSFVEPRETFEINVMGTVNVLDAVRLHGERVRAIVNVTSDKCYENRERERGYREDEPMGGDDPYSSSKGCAELVSGAFRRSFFSGRSQGGRSSIGEAAADAGGHGARLATARAGNVIGGGDWAEDRLVADIMRAALAGERVRVRNPGSIRPWQHVINPLSGYLVLGQALWDSPEHAAAWNFGPADGEVRSVGWIVERVGQLWPGGLRWECDDGPHPPEARYLRLDSTRAREILGWHPLVGLDAALESIVEWYLKLGEGADMRAVTLGQIERFQCEHVAASP